MTKPESPAGSSALTAPGQAWLSDRETLLQALDAALSSIRFLLRFAWTWGSLALARSTPGWDGAHLRCL